MFAGFSIDFHDFPVIVALNMNQTVSDDIDEEIHNCFLYQNKVNSLNKILPLVLVLSLVLVIGNQVQDAYGSSPNTLTMEVTAVPVIPPTITVHVEDKDDNTDPTNPCDNPAVAATCTDPLQLIAVGQTFTVFAAGGDLTNETFFYLGTDATGDEFEFTNKNQNPSEGKVSLHTSCSAPLIGETGSIGGYTLKVISQQGGSGSHCPDPPDIVGGHGGPIDKTALMVTGAQLNASWMIPVLVSAIGIGLFVVTRKS